MTWYDTFSRFYDLSIERSYRAPRRLSFELLKEGQGDVIVDLAGGTGQNFPLLEERFAERSMRLVGIDLSAGMLERAAGRIEKSHPEGFALLQADARSVTKEHLASLLGDRSTADYVVCTLGFSVMPEWEAVFERSFNLLEPGGQFLIMDVWAERRVPQTWVVERMAGADLRRRVWQPLEAISEGFELRFLPGSAHFHGGRLFAATGFKKAS